MSENISENKKLNVVESMAPSQRKYLDRLIRELEEIAGGRDMETIMSSKNLDLINLYSGKVRQIRKFLEDRKVEEEETLEEAKVRLIEWGKKLPLGYDIDTGREPVEWEDIVSASIESEDQYYWQGWLEDNFNFSDFPLIKTKGNWILDNLDIEDLPENVEFHELQIRTCHKLKKIGLIKAKSLEVINCENLENIENGVEVTDWVKLTDLPKLKSLPGSIKAFDIDITDCDNFAELEEGVNPVTKLSLWRLPKFSHFPTSFKKTATLLLSYLDSLQSIGDVEVTDFLSLDNLSQMTEFPPHIRKLMFLEVLGGEITRLPDDLCVDDNLNLKKSKISNIPAATKNLYQLILTGSAVQKLPDDLIVTDKLDISETNISHLPASFVGVKDMNIAKTQIVDFLEEFYGSKLDISDTGIRYLPPMSQLKTLIAANTELDHLPEVEHLDVLKISSPNIKILQEARRLAADGVIGRLETI